MEREYYILLVVVSLYFSHCSSSALCSMCSAIMGIRKINAVLMCVTCSFNALKIQFIPHDLISLTSSGERFMKLFVSDFHRQMLKATDIHASDWLTANLSVKITDKMLHETLPGNE